MEGDAKRARHLSAEERHRENLVHAAAHEEQMRLVAEEIGPGVFLALLASLSLTNLLHHYVHLPGFDVDLLGPNGMAALHMAALNLSVSAARALVDAGANLMGRATGQFTALHFACCAGNCEMVRFLLEREPRLLNLRTELGHTAVACAVMGNHAPVVALLVSLGQSISAFDSKGRSLVHIAVTHGHLDMTRELVRLGAPVLDADGPMVVLACAMMCEEPALMRYFVQELGMDVTALDHESGKSALHAAAKCGLSPEKIRLLADWGVSLTALDVESRQPIHHAAWGGHAKTVATFLEFGVPVNCICAEFEQPLHYAALSGSVETVEVLLDAGAHVNERNSGFGIPGSSPLHHAASIGNKQVVQLLVDRGADCESLNFEEEYPFHVAAAHGHHELFDLLHVWNRPVRDGDPECKALIFAAENGHTKAVSVLAREFGISVDYRDEWEPNALQLAIQNGHCETVRLLLELGADTDDYVEDCPNILFLAEDEEMLRLLLDHDNFDIYAQDEHTGANILHYAVTSDRFGVVRSLFDVCVPARNVMSLVRATELGLCNATSARQRKRIALLNCADKTGRTPLHRAALEGKVEMVKLLRRFGAATGVTDNNGMTPLNCALSADRLQVVAELLLPFDPIRNK